MANIAIFGGINVFYNVSTHFSVLSKYPYNDALRIFSGHGLLVHPNSVFNVSNIFSGYIELN